MHESTFQASRFASIAAPVAIGITTGVSPLWNPIGFLAHSSAQRIGCERKRRDDRYKRISSLAESVSLGVSNVNQRV